MELDPRLPLAGFSHREDPRDALVLPLGVGELDPTKPIGCASARRTLQLRRLFPGQPVAPVRGNVQTRLRKLDEGQYAALVLAAAGLRRLGLEERIARYFTTEEMIPAAGQGILAVQGPGWDRLRSCGAGLCPQTGRRLLLAGGGLCHGGRRYADPAGDGCGP